MGLGDLPPWALPVVAAAGGLVGFYVGRLTNSDRKEAQVALAIRLIDEVHVRQPRLSKGQMDEGEYCLQVERWVEKLTDGKITPELRIAARAQHFERHCIKRAEYEMTTAGYHKWRSAVKKRQGERLAEVVAGANLDKALLARVKGLVSKSLPLSDPAMQIIEDAACLVLLDRDVEAFAEGKEEAKIIDVVQKTWKKMSERARAEALTLNYSPEVKAILDKALA
mmetsp:Transcript_43298/g.111831  ORF Transcript_43298/g.111831 Transcript_43298/m.111831 type:complete len:224 (-) Transcript_43298:200-871(-)